MSPAACGCLLLGSRSSYLSVLRSLSPYPLWPAGRLYPSPAPPIPWEEILETWSWGLFWRALCGHRDWELTLLSRLELCHVALHWHGACCYSYSSFSTHRSGYSVSPNMAEACVCSSPVCYKDLHLFIVAFEG